MNAETKDAHPRITGRWKRIGSRFGGFVDVIDDYEGIVRVRSSKSGTVRKERREHFLEKFERAEWMR